MERPAVRGWNGPAAGTRAERSEVWGAAGSFYSQAPVLTSAEAVLPAVAAFATWGPVRA